MRADPGRDLYVEWCPEIGDVVFAGSREEMLARLWDGLPHGFDPIPGYLPEQVLDRVDETGTSAAFGVPREGSFDDDRLVVREQGVLPRRLLGRYAELVEAGEHDEASALLERLDDEPGVDPDVGDGDG